MIESIIGRSVKRFPYTAEPISDAPTTYACKLIQISYDKMHQLHCEK